MRKTSFRIVLATLIFISGCGKDKVDITKTNFDYDVPECNQYFELIDCIIDKDPDPNYTLKMRKELKDEIKNIQKLWKDFSQEELTTKCREELSKFDLEKDRLASFDC